MKEIGKYNIFKALSIVMTFVPILVMTISFKGFIVKDAGASISFVGVIGLIIAFLFLKSKIAENIKIPSVFVFCTILFVSILFIEQLLIPLKYISLVGIICGGIDEISFKRLYQRNEILLPENSKVYKHFGFYFCKTDVLIGENNEQE